MTEDAEQWTFDVTLERTTTRTRARILVRTGDGHEFSGAGVAHQPEGASDLAHVSHYLAVGRALSDLTEELLEAVTADVEAVAVRRWEQLPAAPLQRAPLLRSSR